MVLHLRDAIERVFLALAMVQLCPDSVGSVGRKLIRFRVHYSFEVQVESTYCEWQTAYLRPYILPPFVHSAETLRLPWKWRGRSMGGITVPVNVEPYHNEFCPCLFAVIINEPAIPVNGSVFWGYSFGMCVMRVSHPFSGVFLLRYDFFHPGHSIIWCVIQCSGCFSCLQAWVFQVNGKPIMCGELRVVNGGCLTCAFADNWGCKSKAGRRQAFRTVFTNDSLIFMVFVF